MEVQGPQSRRVHKLRNGPGLIGNAPSLCWRCPQCLMDTAEIVMRDIQGDGAQWLSSFFEKPFVRRVNRRDDIRSERFCHLGSQRHAYSYYLPSGGAWPADERINWLKMLVMSFQVAYGTDAQIEIDKKEAAH